MCYPLGDDWMDEAPVSDPMYVPVPESEEVRRETEVPTEIPA